MWFLTSAQFSAWKSSADSLLWINGKRMFADILSNDCGNAYFLLHSRVWQDYPEVRILRLRKSTSTD